MTECKVLESFLDNHLRELTSIIARLREIQAALDAEDYEQAKQLVDAELNLKDQFGSVRQQIQTLHPDFAQLANQALAEGKITKLVWQVGYCLKIKMSPVEIAKVLPLSNRTISVYGTRLRKLGILEPVSK